MLTKDVGSRYVYENKQKHDKMPDEISDIFGTVTAISQEIADFEGQFAAICGSRASLGWGNRVRPDGMQEEIFFRKFEAGMLLKINHA